MTKASNNFIKKLKKLDDYFILREEDEYFILGTNAIIKEHVEIHNTFSIHASIKDRKMWVFFIIGLDENYPELNEFRKKDLPILVLPKNIADSKISAIKEHLDNYVKMMK